ncbi:MAG: hypothetical protein LC640_06745 [Frankia sp.]|nr:hypothetical protein [Frankia sp.]
MTALAQKLVQLTAPGVPDVYQGTEVWEDNLVDPDNRRPVDYPLRRGLLAELDDLSATDVWARRAEGLPKLLVTSRALRLRRARPDLFDRDAGYAPLAARGELADHVVAFTRAQTVATVVPRLVVGLDDWRGTTLVLPPGDWRDDLTGAQVDGGDVSVGELLSDFPVALLARR